MQIVFIIKFWNVHWSAERALSLSNVQHPSNNKRMKVLFFVEMLVSSRSLCSQLCYVESLRKTPWQEHYLIIGNNWHLVDAPKKLQETKGIPDLYKTAFSTPSRNPSTYLFFCLALLYIQISVALIELLPVLYFSIFAWMSNSGANF